MQKIIKQTSSCFVLIIAILLFVPCFTVTIDAKESSNDYSELQLYPGGMAFGVKISSPGLTIVKFTSKRGRDVSSAYLAGLREGDIITRVNGIKVTSIESFVKEVDKSAGNTLQISAIRNNKELTFQVKPKYSTDDGKYKTGIWVKDSTTGIGTVTFINPENGSFGGLGHAICDSSTGKIIPVGKGVVMNVCINGVKKGEVGSAGELKGSFLNKRIGVLNENSACGVFGVLSKSNISPSQCKMNICKKEDLKEGDAYILCTLDEGAPQKYKVKISNIDYSSTGPKSFRIKVTDPELIKKTGGIVQGMSGSPIIQDNKLVGAVTHVLINDPTSGYGIFIENMLNSMPKILK